MHDAGDMELLRNYSSQGSEEAFVELVRRHINLVYSAALRHAGIAVHAEEITQAVFIILARKAGRLRPDTVPEAWLYETTRLTTLSFLRGERRRQAREQEAYMQSTLTESTDASVWHQLAPLLDEAMTRLEKKDREAVVLRYFKEKNLGEVAAAMKITEAAAQRRVLRAVEKLRQRLTKRGVALSSAALSGAISANSVQAAPVGLSKSISVVAMAKGAAAGTSTLTLVKGALKLMAWTKAKTAIVVGAAVILAAGTTTTLIVQHLSQKRRNQDTANIAGGVIANPGGNDTQDTGTGVVIVEYKQFAGKNQEIVKTEKNTTINIKGDKIRTDFWTDTGEPVSIIYDPKTGDPIWLYHIEKKFVKEKRNAPGPAPANVLWPKLVDTGNQEKVGEYNTEIYTAEMQGKISTGEILSFKSTFWVTKDIANYASIREQMKKRAGIVLGSETLDHWKIDGMAVKTEGPFNDELRITETLVSAKGEPLDDAEFQIPADYTEAKDQSEKPGGATTPELGESDQPLVGVGVALGSEGRYAKVTEIIPGGAAEKEGHLQVGDRIIAVAQGERDFVDVSGMNLNEVVSLIRGKKGDPVRLKIIPANAADPSQAKVVVIVRDEVKPEKQGGAATPQP